MTKTTIIGTTSWGKTLGWLLSKNGMTVKIWARTDAEAEELNKKRNPDHLSFTSNVTEAVTGTDLLIWAVPSQSFRQNVKKVKSCVDESSLLISATKGLELDTGKRMSEILTEEINPNLRDKVCVLSGPNLSQEIAQGLPAFSTVAATCKDVAEEVQKLLTTPNFTILVSSDIIGVELGGALKNITALGAGMMDGLGLGNNAKAAFIALSWTEIISLSVALGAEKSTLYGVAGLGDLIATCSSPLSRNHRVGCDLAKGRSLKEIITSTHEVAEGVNTTVAARNLARKMRLQTPIIDLIYRVLFEALPPVEAFTKMAKLDLDC